MLKSILKTGKMELKSRLVLPPMATEKSSGGIVSDALVEYYREMTKGGYLGLAVTEHSFVSPEGKASINQVSIADDACIDGLRRIVEAVHENGVPILAQISHAGSAARTDITGLEVISASSVINPGLVARRRGEPQVPREMTENDIERIRDCFVAAALRAKAAGFDGVEIHCAHGYFLDQFYSPLTNKRTDRYCGSTIAGRTRIQAEIIKNVRDAAGDEFLISFRWGASDYMEGGSTIEEIPEAAGIFAQAGADIISVSGGMCAYDRSATGIQGWFSELSEAVKDTVDIPVLLTGGITDRTAAEDLLNNNKADLIGVGRAFLKDRLLPKKWIEG